MSEHHLRDVAGIVTGAELKATVDAIAEWQLESGMVPMRIATSKLSLTIATVRSSTSNSRLNS